ncbi:MAG: hypothetical protein D6722_23780, partial [Bacteroidetes bacterium]
PYSLCNNNVQVVFPAPDGTFWVGTYGGLDRFDPASERFYHYPLYPDDPGTSISCLAADTAGRLWVGTGKGMFALSPEDSMAQAIPLLSASTGRPLDKVDILVMDWEVPGHRLLLGTNLGFLYTEVGTTGIRIDTLRLTGQPVTALLPPREAGGPVWAGTPEGLFALSSTHTRGPFAPATYDHSPGFAEIQDLSYDSDGRLWIGTFAGLFQYEPSANRFFHYTEELHNPYSLSDNAIFDLFCDQKGDIWIGTYFGGVNVIHQEKNVFRHYFPMGQAGNMQGKAVSGMVEAPDGQLWIGTEDGGLHAFDPEREYFVYYPYQSGQKGPSSNNIQDLCLGRQGDIWIATYGGGLDRFSPGTGQFEHFRHRPGQAGSLPVDELLTLLLDRQNRLWVGTDKGGLCRLDPGSSYFRHYFPDTARAGALASDVVMALYEDRSGAIWVGHFGGGLDRYEPDADAFTHFGTQQAGGLTSDQITCLYEDRQGRFWVGTRGGGLNLLDRRSGQARAFRKADGLPDNTIYGILEDASGYLWLSSHRGLCRFSPDQQTFRTFRQADGLQSNQFSPRAFLAASDGELYFGGINGLNRFDPLRIRDNTFVPPVVITGFRLFNQEVDFRSPDQPLQQAPGTAQRVVLNHHQTVFGFEFRVLDYTQPENNHYAFKMEGFDEYWNEVGPQRMATFTNLDPGTYTFRVRGANNHGKWNLAGDAMEVVVLPPPWRSGWAYALYALLGLGLLLLVRHYTLTRFRLQQDLKLERLRREKTEELEQAKQRFFTNISHELRTPLTLILGPLEELQAQSNPRIRDTLGYMHHNTMRLLRLINQLMDFSKMESGYMKIEPTDADLLSAVRQTVASFAPLADRSHIHFEPEVPEGSFFASFDLEKVDQILYNLLSNAFKFTPEQGQIRLQLQLPAEPRPGELIRIRVCDTGPGIPEGEQARVFERFYQLPGERTRQGTGIGLALSQELARMHGGRIDLESTPGTGSCFTLCLPFQPAQATPSP